MNKNSGTIFIGSSSEKRLIAEKMNEILKQHYHVQLWYDKNSFKLSFSTLESLIASINQCDFAIFIFSPDDKTESRGSIEHSIRDNILFEIGLFMGALGRERTFILLDGSKGVKIPSDFNGITMASYVNSNPDNLKEDLDEAALKIISTISSLGNRESIEIEKGKKLSHFDYKRFSESIYHCRNKIRILHTYVLPFCNDPAFSEYRDLIITNFRHAIAKDSDFKIEFLFLNPYSASMDLRVKQRAPQNAAVPQHLRNMYGFFYLLTRGRKYADLSKHIRIRVYDQMPPFAMFQADNEMFVTSFPKGRPVHNTYWYLCHKDSVFGQLVKGRFHEIYSDSETYELDVCYFISIRERKFHYIKHRNFIYIGTTIKTQNAFERIIKFDVEMQIEWLKKHLSGKFSELFQSDVSEYFEKKFPPEKFIKYYVFVHEDKNEFPEFIF